MRKALLIVSALIAPAFAQDDEETNSNEDDLSSRLERLLGTDTAGSEEENPTAPEPSSGAAAQSQAAPASPGSTPDQPQSRPANAPLDELDALVGSDEVDELDLLSGNTGVDDFDATPERQPVSVTLRALDKTTATYTDIEIGMHQIATFGNLELQPRFCDKRPPEEFPETTVFLEVYDLGAGGDDVNLKVDPSLLNLQVVEEPQDVRDDNLPVLDIPTFGGDEAPEEDVVEILEPVIPEDAAPTPEVLEGPQAIGENIFRGWMFASSPALNALEHPVYDVWVIDCKTVSVETETPAE